jgi:hypothetical protein
MTKNVTAFGASQPGRMKSALFTPKGDGSALPREPNIILPCIQPRQNSALGLQPGENAPSSLLKNSGFG